MMIALWGEQPMIECTCPRCGKLLWVTDDSAGRTLRCGSCGAPVKVPEAERLEEVPEEDEDGE